MSRCVDEELVAEARRLWRRRKITLSTAVAILGVDEVEARALLGEQCPRTTPKAKADAEKAKAAGKTCQTCLVRKAVPVSMAVHGRQVCLKCLGDERAAR